MWVVEPGILCPFKMMLLLWYFNAKPYSLCCFCFLMKKLVWVYAFYWHSGKTIRTAQPWYTYSPLLTVHYSLFLYNMMHHICLFLFTEGRTCIRLEFLESVHASLLCCPQKSIFLYIFMRHSSAFLRPTEVTTLPTIIDVGLPSMAGPEQYVLMFLPNVQGWNSTVIGCYVQESRSLGGFLPLK